MVFTPMKVRPDFFCGSRILEWNTEADSETKSITIHVTNQKQASNPDWVMNPTETAPVTCSWNDEKIDNIKCS